MRRFLRKTKSHSFILTSDSLLFTTSSSCPHIVSSTSVQSATASDFQWKLQIPITCNLGHRQERSGAAAQNACSKKQRKSSRPTNNTLQREMLAVLKSKFVEPAMFQSSIVYALSRSNKENENYVSGPNKPISVILFSTLNLVFFVLGHVLHAMNVSEDVHGSSCVTTPFSPA